MKAIELKHSMKLMPAKPGTCVMCATKHGEHEAHNLTSLFYGMRFKMKYGRDPTWADAVAHLDPQLGAEWRRALESLGHAWSETDSPIAEPYAMSEGFGVRS